MSIYSIVYSFEDESPSLVALYSRREDVIDKMKEILEVDSRLLKKHDSPNYIVYTGLISLSLCKIDVEEILSYYYVVIYWSESFVAQILSIRKTIEQARYYVDNEIEHDCKLCIKCDDKIVWENEGPMTVISIQRYMVDTE